MKKQIAILLSSLFIVMGISAVFAAENDISVTNTGITAVQKGGHSGTSALRVQGTAGNKTYNISLDIQAGDTLSFWAKGVKHYNQAIVLSNSRWLQPSYADTEKCLLTKTATGSAGWVQYTTVPEVFETLGSNTIRFVGEPTPSDTTERWLVDDIVVTRADGSVRYKIGFEKAEIFSNTIVNSYGSVNADIKFMLFEQISTLYPYSLDVFTAAYDGENRLTEVKKTTLTLNEGDVEIFKIHNVSHDFLLDKESGGYTFKTFVWDGSNQLVPIDGATKIEDISIADADMILNVREWTKEIKELIDKCEEKGISTDYELANWAVLDRYSNDYEFVGGTYTEPALANYLKKDLDAGNTERAEWNYYLLGEIYTETKEKLNNYLNGTEEAKSVSRFVQSTPRIDGKMVYAKTDTDGVIEERPFFFTGFGHFSELASDIPNLPEFGYNICQQSVDPINCIEYGGSDETPFVAVENAATEYIHRSFKEADKNNVKIDLLLGWHNVPKWMTEKWTDFESPDLETEETQRILMHPMNKKLVETYVKFIFEQYGDYESLNSICIANEPTTNTNVEFYQIEWAGYLENKYQNIDNLNAAYSSSYTDFSEVPMSKQNWGSGLVRFYDYKNFNDKILTEFLTFVKDEVRKYNQDIPVHIKMMTTATVFDWNHLKLMGYGTQHELFAEISDYNGNDVFAYLDGDGAIYDIPKMEFFQDIQTGIKDAPCFNSEDHMIEDYNNVLTKRHGDHCYSKLWQSFVHANAMSIVWQWGFITDPDNHSYGLPPSDPNAMVKIAKVGFDANRLAYELEAIIEKEPEIAILQSYRTRVWNKNYLSSLYNVWWAAMQNGAKTELISEEQIERIHDYKVLIITDATNVSPETLAEIKSYADSGKKILIFGKNSLMYDWDNILNDTKTVNQIRGAAEKVTTSFGNGIIVQSPTSDEYFNIIHTLLEEQDLNEVEIFDASTDAPARNIEFEYADYNGKKVVNIISYDDTQTKNLYIVVNGVAQTELFELIENQSISDVFEVEVFKPKLIMVG